jgi:hypothetical protein
MHVAIPPLPQYAFMCGVQLKKKQRDNFTFVPYTVGLHGLGSRPESSI